MTTAVVAAKVGPPDPHVSLLSLIEYLIVTEAPFALRDGRPEAGVVVDLPDKQVQLFDKGGDRWDLSPLL